MACYSFNLRSLLPVVAGIAGLVILAIMTGTSPTKLAYDEPYHIDLAKRVCASGWREALSSPDNLSATGPLYAAIQIAASPLTGFKAPAIRWVNFICLVLVIVTLAKTNQRESPHPNWSPAISIVAVPFLWPAAGMALTELPALEIFTFFVFALLQVLRIPDDKISVWSLGWAGCGLALGLSILGRQTYLVVLPVVAALFLAAPRKWMFWLFCLVVAVSSCGWLFILWGGLVPPSLHQATAGLRLEYGVLSLSYVAAATLFLSPQWLKIKSVKVAMGAILFGIGLVLFTREHASPPAKSLLLKIFGDWWGLVVGFCIGALLAAVAVVWLWNTLLIAWRERHDPLRAFLF